LLLLAAPLADPQLWFPWQEIVALSSGDEVERQRALDKTSRLP